MSDRSSTLADAIVNTFWSLISSLHTCLPGRIEKYSREEQKANVKPLIKKQYLDGSAAELPVISNVPVVFPRTQRAGITFPLEQGDGVLLVFAERALDRWLSSGVDSGPGDSRKFDLSDAIAIPGLFSFKQENLAISDEDVEIHNSGQRITIKRNGDIDVGIDVKKLVTEEFALLFDNHVHNVSVAGTPAAQAGTTSSPSAIAGTGPLAVAPIPGPPVNTFNGSITNSHLTSKAKAE